MRVQARDRDRRNVADARLLDRVAPSEDVEEDEERELEEHKERAQDEQGALPMARRRLRQPLRVLRARIAPRAHARRVNSGEEVAERFEEGVAHGVEEAQAVVCGRSAGRARADQQKPSVAVRASRCAPSGAVRCGAVRCGAVRCAGWVARVPLEPLARLSAPLLARGGRPSSCGCGRGCALGGRARSAAARARRPRVQGTGFGVRCVCVEEGDV